MGELSSASRASCSALRRIARATVGPPALRLIGSIKGASTTEPIIALTFDDGPDPEGTPEILDLLVLLNQQLHKTVVMVTHDPKAAKRAHRALILEKGFIYQDAVA